MRRDALILFGDVFFVVYNSQISNKTWDDDTFFFLILYWYCKCISYDQLHGSE